MNRPTFDVTVDAQPIKVKDIADAVLERYGIGGGSVHRPCGYRRTSGILQGSGGADA